MAQGKDSRYRGSGRLPRLFTGPLRSPDDPMDFREATTFLFTLPANRRAGRTEVTPAAGAKSIKFKFHQMIQNCSINLKRYSSITPIIQQRPAHDQPAPARQQRRPATGRP